MIDLKTWGEFLFDFWKLIKKYHSNDTDNFQECVTEMNALMKTYPQNIFNAMVYAFLQQKSVEAIR